LETSAQAERGRNGSPMMEYALAAQHHFSSQTPEAGYLPRNRYSSRSAIKRGFTAVLRA